MGVSGRLPPKAPRAPVAQPWSHRTKEIHLGVAKWWLEFFEDEEEFDIPDFVGRLRPGKIKVRRMDEQPERPPCPTDELVHITKIAWRMVDECEWLWKSAGRWLRGRLRPLTPPAGCARDWTLNHAGGTGGP